MEIKPPTPKDVALAEAVFDEVGAFDFFVRQLYPDGEWIGKAGATRLCLYEWFNDIARLLFMLAEYLKQQNEREAQLEALIGDVSKRWAENKLLGRDE